MSTVRSPVFLAILAAIFYGLSVPAAKLLLVDMPPVFMASLLYLGAGAGMMALTIAQNKKTTKKEAGITKKELPYTAAMVALDIVAPIIFMIGLSMTSAVTVSLLGNFEIVATTIIALFVFREAVGKRMWLAIAFITVSSVILSVEDFESLKFSLGALFVLLGCICWGIENNCTRMLSLKDPTQIVVIKGIGSGFGSLVVALFLGSVSTNVFFIVCTLLLGFVAYGLSIYFYILAQRSLGAVRTSAYYALAPFFGAGLSFIVFNEAPTYLFLTAIAIMTAGAYLAVFEKHEHDHEHAQIIHEHRHNHNDGHHTHPTEPATEEEHSHAHTHEQFQHSHKHTPDLHHRHIHPK